MEKAMTIREWLASQGLEKAKNMHANELRELPESDLVAMHEIVVNRVDDLNGLNQRLLAAIGWHETAY
jgi:hypothetical protein